MLVTIKLFGTLRRFSQPGTPGLWAGPIPAGARLLDLLEILGTTDREVAAAAIDGIVCPLETTIPEGAEITLVTPVGGGC